MQIHGGERYQNSIKYDFSVNINPIGMPQKVLSMLQGVDPSVFEWYPDAECLELRKAIAKWHNVEVNSVLCGNGATELIYSIVRAIYFNKVKIQQSNIIKALLPIPSFSEYEKALRSVGALIDYYELTEEEGFCFDDRIVDKITDDYDILFICNPNNPVGNSISNDLLEKILKKCQQTKTFVALDECFLELAEYEHKNLSLRYQILTEKFTNVIVLKAFTKCFALAGVRLGYCICADYLMLQAVKNQMAHWNVSGIAQYIGVTCMVNVNPHDYISQSNKLIFAEKKYLLTKLKEFQITVLPGDANYICFYSELPFYQFLLEKHILIRDCSNYPGMKKGYYRISVNKHEENEILITTIMEYLKKKDLS